MKKSAAEFNAGADPTALLGRLRYSTVKTQLEQILGSLGMQPHPDLTQASVTLFADSMKTECRSLATNRPLSMPMISMELGAYDVVGAYSTGSPPSFGKYANCHVERRCFGCERECSVDGALIDLATSRGRPLLLVVIGGSIAYPTWLRVVVIDPGKRWSGGVFIPVLFRRQCGVVLEPESAGTCLVVAAEGLAVTQVNPCKQWLVAAFDRARLSFCFTLHRIRHAVNEATETHAPSERLGA